jgi:hypothetical protein
MRNFILEGILMKKICVVLLLLVCVSLGVFAQNSQYGVITELSGTVELKPAGTTSFTAAKTGDTIALDTIVSTGFKSTAVITVGSATIIARPLTRLTLSEITASQGSETINVNLQAGRVRVDVKPPAGTKASFTVQSPHATASVRGTEFEQDTRNVQVSEGTVAYRGTSGPAVLVPAGSSTRVSAASSAGSAPTKVQDPIVNTVAALAPLPPVGTETSAPAATAGTVITAPVHTSVNVGLDFN